MKSTESIYSGFFDKKWHIYQKILAQNYMNHREIYTVFHEFIIRYYSKPFSLLDLGCGDASFVATALAQTPVQFYQGIDLSEVALKIAQNNLNSLPCQKQLIPGNFQQILPSLAEKNSKQFNIILASFSLHHLSLEQKDSTINSIHQRLKNQGIFLLIDVVRLPEESREDYIRRYLDWMKTDWSLLTSEEVNLAGEHISSSDFPETLETLQLIAEKYQFYRFECLYQDPQKTSQFLVFYHH